MTLCYKKMSYIGIRYYCIWLCTYYDICVKFDLTFFLQADIVIYIWYKIKLSFSHINSSINEYSIFFQYDIIITVLQFTICYINIIMCSL